MSQELFKPDEAAKRLSVTSKSVRRWLRTGRLKGVRVGGRWRIRQGDLDDFIRGGDPTGHFTGKPDVVVVQVQAGDGPQGPGRLVISAQMGERLAVSDGDLLVLIVGEGGELHAIRGRDQIGKFRGILADDAPGRSLAEELVQERRKEE